MLLFKEYTSIIFLTKFDDLKLHIGADCLCSLVADILQVQS